jgi:hypothetical protein
MRAALPARSDFAQVIHRASLPADGDSESKLPAILNRLPQIRLSTDPVGKRWRSLRNPRWISKCLDHSCDARDRLDALRLGSGHSAGHVRTGQLCIEGM